MPDRVPLLLKVFKVELEETENDVLGLLEYYAGRLEKDEITPYVWKENRALLRREISCVKELKDDIDTWTPVEGRTGPEVLEDLKVFLHQLVKERGYPELVSLVIDRIAVKVARYME